MKSTRKSLLLSALSLLLCIALLMGTTFAWFTDKVESGVNTITAGNLDIELEYFDGSEWKPVTTGTKLFDDSALWEPGHTEVAYLRLSNKGTLAFKYSLAINVANEVGGTNKAGQSFKLSDYIYMGVNKSWNGTPYENREAAIAAVSGAGKIATYAEVDKMEAGATAKTFALVVYMPTTVGDEANYKTGTTVPSIELGVEVTATQFSAESDSFDKYYDVKTEPILVYTAKDFTAAVKQAQTNDIIQVMVAGLTLTADYTEEKVLNIKGADIATLTVNAPNGAVHVWNNVGTVVGTAVAMESAYLHGNVGTLNATAGHFVVEKGATVTEIKTPETVSKDLIIEVKGEVTTMTVPEADTDITVKVEEGAEITTLTIADGDKIVLKNQGTIGNAADITEKVETNVGVDEDKKELIITDTFDLRQFAQNVNGGNNYKGWTVKLTANLDLAGINWTPIGRTNRFEGTFDGQDHTIKNLTSVLDSTSKTMYGNGLFGDITGGAVLKNFTVENANVYDKVDGKGNVYGIVCGYAYGTVTFENITVKNSKVSAFGKVGAILGMAADPGTSVTTIKNCKVENTEIKGAYNCATFAGLTQNKVVLEGNTQNNVAFKYSSRYGAAVYTDIDETTAAGDTANGHYWKYEDNYYMAAWADLYNELKESTIKEGTIGIDAITHNSGKIYVKSEEAQSVVSAALAEAQAGDIITLPKTGKDVSIKLPALSNNVIIKGDGETKVDAVGSGSIASVPNGATFDGIVFDFGTAGYHGFQHAGDITFKNCTLNGLLFSYGNLTFENCTFNAPESDYSMWTYGNDATYTDCTFNGYGKWINVYCESNSEVYNITFNRCKFINKKATANKAAINVKDTCGATQLKYKVVINDCSYEGTAPATKDTDTLKVYNPVVQLDDIGAGPSNIIIIQDGVTLWPAAE